MKKKFLSTAIVLLMVVSASAQKNSNSSDYKTALGVKFYPGAVTIKHFINDKVALEGLGYFHPYGARITGLYEFHFDIPNVPGLKWYVGPGAHIGFYNANKFHNNTNRGGGSAVGIDGVLGIDYKIKTAPINLSLDWQPSFEFGNDYNYYNGFGGNWGGIAIRYVFQ